LRSALALIAMIWALAIAANTGVALIESPAPPHPHSTSLAPGGQFADVLEHDHIRDGSTSIPEMFATAVLPRIATSLIAIGLMLAVATIAGWLSYLTSMVVRGPPRPPVAILTGRQLATRFCICRR
jgi:lipoprotein LpqS